MKKAKSASEPRQTPRKDSAVAADVKDGVFKVERHVKGFAKELGKENAVILAPQDMRSLGFSSGDTLLVSLAAVHRLGVCWPVPGPSNE